MRAIQIVVSAAAAHLCIMANPAFASRHPEGTAPTHIDVASSPVYAPDSPVKLGPFHHRSAHSVLSRRDYSERHRRPREARHAVVHGGGYHPSQNPISSTSEALLALPAAFVDALAWATVDEIRSVLASRVVHTPRRIEGKIAVGNATFNFVSGGSGWSIPYGNYAITPDAVGRWGTRHGAIGLADGEIWDKRLGRYREGIELHAATRSGSTAGCIGVEGWRDFKGKVLAVISEFGHAFLHVGPSGASVGPQRVPMEAIVIEVRVAEDQHRRVRYAHRRYRHYAAAY